MITDYLRKNDYHVLSLKMDLFTKMDYFSTFHARIVLLGMFLLQKWTYLMKRDRENSMPKVVVLQVI